MWECKGHSYKKQKQIQSKIENIIAREEYATRKFGVTYALLRAKSQKLLGQMPQRGVQGEPQSSLDLSLKEDETLHCKSSPFEKVSLLVFEVKEKKLRIEGCLEELE